MSMVVQHNMQSMNANRMLGITTGQQAKSTEKLSSGYRINRAADDAAGLSISEKMRKQIRGLDRASSNAQDGVSAVQTAEGALTEVHSMLQRMNELATQAANGTNSEDDRQSIQNEIDQLTTEIDRVAETTKFNESYLLKGATDGSKKTAYVNAHDAGIKGTLGESVDGKTSFKLDAALKAGDTITVAGEELTIGDAKSVDDYEKLSEIGNTKVQIGDVYTKADGTEMTVTNKATESDVRNFIKNKASANNTDKIGTLKLADGTTYDITNAAETGSNPSQVQHATITKTTADGKVSTIETSTAAGDTFSDLESVLGETSVDLAGATFTSADGKNTYDLVEKINRDELTLFDSGTGTNVIDSNSKNTTINAVLGLTDNGSSAISVGDTLTTYTTDVLGNKVETSKTAYRDETTATYDALSTEIKEGDKIVNDAGETWEFTDKADDASIGAFLKAKYASTGSLELGTVTLANGDTYKLTQSAANANNLSVSKNGAGPVDKAVTKATLSEIMREIDSSASISGATFTDKDGNVYSVEDLKAGEASMFSGGTGGLGTKYATVGAAKTGNTQITGAFTSASYITAGAKAGLTSLSDLATGLNKLAVGSKVNVTSADGKTTTEYTIAGSKDSENGNTLTVDSILGKLKEADAVGWDTDDAGATIDANETYTVVGVDSEEGTTSVKDAYKKIAAALQEASSIGTEEGAEVTSKGDGSFEIKQGTVEVAESLNFSLHVGSEADGTNKINVNLDSMDAAGLGVKGLNLVDDTGVKATYAIDAIADAISKVSAQRSALGAVQNRLEHTISNLDNVVENTTSAESAIRDTDMASEMVNFSKNNILAQAGQSMLAQANQSNQGVLSLLG